MTRIPRHGSRATYAMLNATGRISHVEMRRVSFLSSELFLNSGDAKPLDAPRVRWNVVDTQRHDLAGLHSAQRRAKLLRCLHSRAFDGPRA